MLRQGVVRVGHEVLDIFAEAADRGVTRPGEVPLQGQVIVVGKVGFQVRITPARLILCRSQYVVVDHRPQVVHVRPRERARGGRARNDLVGEIELEIQARQEIIVAVRGRDVEKLPVVRIDRIIFRRITLDRQKIGEHPRESVRSLLRVHIASTDISRPRQSGQRAAQIELHVKRVHLFRDGIR